MLNAMQFFPSWESYFGNPTDVTLGRLSAMYSIGSIASLPITPYISDKRTSLPFVALSGHHRASY